MTRSILLEGEVEVVRKGWTPDPKGSRYCVIDYASDPPARSAAFAMATECWTREPAFAEALIDSLNGEDERAPLLTYEITPLIEVDEGGRFIVCNFAFHYPSRYALRRYWGKVRHEHPELAGHIHSLLQETEQSFADYLESKRPKKKQRKKKKDTKRTGYDF